MEDDKILEIAGKIHVNLKEGFVLDKKVYETETLLANLRRLQDKTSEELGDLRRQLMDAIYNEGETYVDFTASP